MQLRLWAAAVIFAGSYFPLSLILLVQDFGYTHLSETICLSGFSQTAKCVLPFAHARISLSIFLCCLLCLVFSLYLFGATKMKRTAQITKAKYVPSELMNYTLPYVVSFMGVSYSEESKFFGMVIFLGWLFWITHKSGQIILNPLLVVFGWRLYEVSFKYDGDDEQIDCLVFSAGELEADNTVLYGDIQDVMIVRKLAGKSE